MRIVYESIENEFNFLFNYSIYVNFGFNSTIYIDLYIIQLGIEIIVLHFKLNLIHLFLLWRYIALYVGFLE